MSDKSTVFEKTYRDYLAQLAEVDLTERVGRLGVEASEEALLIPFFGATYRVSSGGVIAPGGQRAGFALSVVLFKYILTYPKETPAETEWVTYRFFKDAQPLQTYFARETLGPIETSFAGRLHALEQAGEKLGGRVLADNAAYDLSIQFGALPQIPLLMRFNDRDDELPAQCTLFFRASVEHLLDMESLAILGALFSSSLVKGQGSRNNSISDHFR